MQVKRARIRSDELHGTVYLPGRPGAGGARWPGVVVLGGSEGGVPEHAAAVLAGAGFAALAIAYFGIEGLPRELEDIPIERVARACAWLADRPEVDGVALVGRSRGGELALLAASHFPELVRAVVAYVPSSVVWQSAPSSQLRARATARSSWTLAGRALPFVPSATVGADDVELFERFLAGRPIAFRPIFERALGDADAVAAAAIPVERIAGPVLVISAGDDQLWPSQLFGDQVIRRRERHDRTGDRHLVFAGAGHLLGIPGTMTGPHAPQFPAFVMGGSRAADDRASQDAWPVVVHALAGRD